MFLEYATLKEAKEAVRGLNGHKLDKNHVFAVNLFGDFDKYTTVADEWTPPTPTPYNDPVSHAENVFFERNIRFGYWFKFW